MKILFLIFILLVFLFPASELKAEKLETSWTQSEFKALTEGKLSNAELLDIAGQGNKAPFPAEIEGGNSRVILWDEGCSGNVMIDLSTGYGNVQRNTLSILGR